MREDPIAIPVPAPLVRKIENRIKGTNFKSVSNYLEYLLTEILADEAGEETEDLNTAKDDLKEMGYID
ncbi:CopG family transcriptional regulator [Candidatus Bathyarchaeota archaeon]|nr:CopG family transcriptional regulator [Nitrososphaerota archaeon]MBQ04547.1 CopG family transcriptional regulator [Candidatus Bathyarchaeota archaeon]